MAITKLVADSITSGAIASTPAFSAKVSSNQSVAASTSTLVAFDTEIFDTDGTYDNTATNYKFTPAVAGKYLITALCKLENIENNRGIFSLYKNGSFLMGTEAAGKVSDAASDVSGTIVYVDDVNTTDYYQIFAYHNYGSNRDLRAESNFAAIKIIE